jgi:surfeit locus 1 family protein
MEECENKNLDFGPRPRPRLRQRLRLRRRLRQRRKLRIGEHIAILSPASYYDCMPFYFKPRVTVFSLIFVALFIRLSFWQWQRYVLNSGIAQVFHDRLNSSVDNLSNILKSSDNDPQSIAFRRVKVSGNYDFAHEMILRNRSYQEQTGSLVITPLQIENTNQHVLVNRGFIPLGSSDATQRKIYQRNPKTEFIGFIREGSTRKWFLSPADPEPIVGGVWIDQWLRIDLGKIGKQLPYPILPFYLEVMADSDLVKMEAELLSPKSAREDIFTPKIGLMTQQPPPETYPIPTYEPLVPPLRNLGYVYEWAFLALLAFLMGIVFQLRPSGRISTLSTQGLSL